MTICAEAICKSDSRKDKTLSFHSFPKSPKLRKIWVDFCKRKDNWNPSTSFLCSKHFEKKNFELNFREQLLNLKSKTRLVKGAFPSIKHEQPSPTEREIRMCSKKRAELVKELLSDKSIGGLQENITPSCSADINVNLGRDDDNLPSVEEIVWKIKYQQQLEKNSQQEKEIEMLRLKCESNEKTISSLTEKINVQSETIHFQLSKLQNRDNLISKVLTKAQKNKLENDKKWVKWSSEDISRALTLRHLSQRTYLHLRNNMSYPLPHLATLRKLASTLNFRNGSTTESQS